MSTETSPSTPSIQLPLALIALTILILLASQVGATMQSTTFIKWQRENLEKQIAQSQTMDKQAAEAIKNREATVKQAGEIQNQLQTLLNDLLELSKTDKEAEEIIKKWNVQRNQAAGAAAPAAGAAAPAAPAAPAAKP